MEEVTTKKYELRELGARDIFSMARIIKKIGINNFKRCIDSEEVKRMISELSDEERQTEESKKAVGMAIVLEVMDVLISRLPECEMEMYSFLSDISGLKQKEIQELPMAEFFEMVVTVLKKPEFKDFFKVASKSFK